MFHRTWKQWFLMSWTINITVRISDNQVLEFTFPSTRWKLLSYLHMIYIHNKFKDKYSNANIDSYLEWTT